MQISSSNETAVIEIAPTWTELIPNTTLSIEGVPGCGLDVQMSYTAFNLLDGGPRNRLIFRSDPAIDSLQLSSFDKPRNSYATFNQSSLWFQIYASVALVLEATITVRPLCNEGELTTQAKSSKNPHDSSHSTYG